jgi:hypothetical protein
MMKSATMAIIIGAAVSLMIGYTAYAILLAIVGLFLSGICAGEEEGHK